MSASIAIRMTPARRCLLLTAIGDGGRIRRVKVKGGAMRFEAGAGPFPAALRDDLGQKLREAGLIECDGWDTFRVTAEGRVAAGEMR